MWAYIDMREKIKVGGRNENGDKLRKFYGKYDGKRIDRASVKKKDAWYDIDIIAVSDLD